MSLPIASSEILQLAFGLVEMPPPSSFEDGSEQSALARAALSSALDAALSSYDWSFASRLVALAPAQQVGPTDPELPGFYSMPARCLAIRAVWPDGARWRIDGSVLRSDQTTGLTIRYTTALDDEGLASPLFRQAVSYAVAALIAPRWTTSVNRAAALADEGERRMMTARLADRPMSSPERWDGRPAGQPDWADEAVAW